MARDWSNLDYDILRLIPGKVTTLENYVCLSLVSSSWLSVLMKQDGAIYSLPRLPPRLILPCCDHEHDDRHSQSQCYRTFSIMDNKVNHLYFPEAYGKKCVGSSHGWLIMVEDTSPAIFMLNPLTRKRIELPPVTTTPEILGFNKKEVGREYIYFNVVEEETERWSLKEIEEFYTLKIILSHEPEEENCIAVAICGQRRRLVFCRIGDTKWTPIENEFFKTGGGFQNDVLYSKGKFYTVDCGARVSVFDASNPQVKKIHEAPNDINRCDAMYLVVDTTGSLLLISRLVHIYEHEDDDNMVEEEEDERQENNQSNNTIYSTRKFKVFKLDEKNKWNNVKDIGENIIFLGENQSVCYSTIEFPEWKRNNIYFTDDNIELKGGKHEGNDIGIFNIGDGIVRKIPCFNEDVPLMTKFPQSVWFTPSIKSIILQDIRTI